MALNLREGSAGVVHVTAAAARTSGSVVVEEGWVGFATTDAASGAVYALDCRAGIKYEITKVDDESKGDYVYVDPSDHSLSLSSATGLIPFAKVVETEGGITYGTPTGKTLIALLPQSMGVGELAVGPTGPTGPAGPTGPTGPGA
jgi:predicted RecA/RadA family phage recombinase